MASSDTRALGDSVGRLAWAAFSEIVAAGDGAADGAPGSFLSPISLWFALGLALRGAGPGSATQQELLHFLRQDKGRLLGLLPPKDAGQGDVDAFLQGASQLSAALSSAAGNSDSGEKLVLANAIWSNKLPLLPAYAAAVEKLFGATAREAATVDPINAWAAEVTNGLIKKAVPPGTKFDVILTNAVYFKGLWEFKFDKAITRRGDFQLSGSSNTTADVEFMHRTFKANDRGASAAAAAAAGEAAAAAGPPLRVTYAQAKHYTAVRLPYVGGRVSAIAVLPSDANASIADALGDISVESLLDPAGYKPPPAGGLEVFLPRFKVSSEAVSLSAPLAKLGVKAAFNADAADFTALSEQRTYVSDVLQSVCVVVDEEGTEAAAVTSVVMMRCAAIIAEPVVVRFDRPFLFLLVDNASQAVLFLGYVKDPSKSA